MNILSIDLEDYFMVTALEKVIKRKDWHRCASRIEESTGRLLDLLDSGAGSSSEGERISTGRICATFFCLGWVAERFPDLIKEIHSRGHEIASHGYDHRRICSLPPESFRIDVRRSKAILEDLTGAKVLGYRAPSYSITRKTLWALDILAEEGFRYDSSIFPVRHDTYGIPDGPRSPCIARCSGREITLETQARNGSNKLSRSPGTWDDPSMLTPGTRALLEFPLSTLRILGQNLPVAGGGYFRFLPLHATLWAIRHINRKDELPFIFYLHPWEIDPDQPRVRGIGVKSSFRHYLNLNRTEDRLKILFRTVPFSSFGKYIEQHIDL
jgi:polysaccharide deacetylase family protein (PEP-CTERM system associated)